MRYPCLDPHLLKQLQVGAHHIHLCVSLSVIAQQLTEIARVVVT